MRVSLTDGTVDWLREEENRSRSFMEAWMAYCRCLLTEQPALSPLPKIVQDKSDPADRFEFDWLGRRFFGRASYHAGSGYIEYGTVRDVHGQKELEPKFSFKCDTFGNVPSAGGIAIGNPQSALAIHAWCVRALTEETAPPGSADPFLRPMTTN